MSDTQDQQVKRVVESMAVAVIAAGVGALTSSKTDLELCFNRTWRQWAPASRFPACRPTRPPDVQVALASPVRRVMRLVITPSDLSGEYVTVEYATSPVGDPVSWPWKP